MSNSLVTITTFVYPHELGVPCSLLESEGVECFVRDEFTTGTFPHFSNSIGGIRLQVRESDAQRALEILIEGGFIHKEDKKTILVEEKMKQTDGTICPYCGSAEIVKGKNFSGKISVLLSILLTIMFIVLVPFFRRNYHCMDCGKNFKNNL
jgi:DNA-directed RNA polymerase subunit RPC12/RpoP